jgi:hypothetical protein
LYREALELFQLITEPTHSDTIKTYTSIATNLHDQGRYEEADNVVTPILPTLQLTQGEAHDDYIEALEFRAILLHCMQMYAIALDIAGLVYEQRQRLISVGYAHYDSRENFLMSATWRRIVKRSKISRLLGHEFWLSLHELRMRSLFFRSHPSSRYLDVTAPTL